MYSSGLRLSRKTLAKRSVRSADVVILFLVMLVITGLWFTAAQLKRAELRTMEAAESYSPALSYSTPDAPVSVAFLGDSFTFGTGAASKSHRWSSLVSREMGWLELNYGFGGTNYGTAGTLRGGKAYADRLVDLTISQPDIVIVSSAGNTMNEDQKAGIADTFKKLRSGLPDARIVATSPFSRAGEYRHELVDFGEIIETEVEAVGGEYLDIGHPLERHKRAMDEDGVHPNNFGHELIADAFVDSFQ